MVIVFANGAGKYDFVIQTSINYALAKLNYRFNTIQVGTLDERIEPYSPNLDLSNEAGIAICGHGSVGQIEGTSAAVIGAFLARPIGGVTKALRKLIVTSCYAGTDGPGTTGTSLVNVLARALEGKGLGGLEIVGYNGPSIKNAQNGFQTTVVNDSKIGAARATQATLKSAFAPSLVPAVGFGGLNAGASEAAAVSSKLFYSEFTRMLDENDVSLSEARGDKVVTVATVLR